MATSITRGALAQSSVFNLGAAPILWSPPAGERSPLLASAGADGWTFAPFSGLVAQLMESA